MAQCQNCGANLHPGFKRCIKCGSPVPETPPPAPASPPQPPAAPAAVAAAAPPAPERVVVLQPHRGGTILALSVISWFCVCGVIILPLIAWVMANKDLRDMNAGTKDPSGRSLVVAGKVLAIILFWLQLVGLIVWGIAFAVTAAQGRV